MKYKMQVKMIDKALLIHFTERCPNLRGPRFQQFVSKLEELLGTSLEKTRIILSPKPLKEARELELYWSRFDEYSFKIRDYVK